LVLRSPPYRDKKVVGVFVRFSCAASLIVITINIFDIFNDFPQHIDEK
jgi:hypothetical protein